MNDAAISHVLATTADPYPHPDYRVCRTPNDLYDYCDALATPSADLTPIGEDTESTPTGATFCHTFSLYPGTGRLIYTADTRMVNEYRNMLIDGADHLHHLFHNYLHDIEAFEGLEFPVGKFTDTMVRAYNLCLGGGNDDDSGNTVGKGSLSLKALAYRLCHMRMTSFEDTVYPHSLPHLQSWLQLCASISAPAPPREPTCAHCTHPQSSHDLRGKRNAHTGPCWHPGCGGCSRFRKAVVAKGPVDKPNALLHRKINLLLSNMQTKPDVDPWDRVRDWWKAARKEDATPGSLAALESVVELFGPHTLPSIEHVPEQELLTYACRDADATLRLYHVLKDYQPWVFYDA